MGQFSWIDCVTGERILNDTKRDVYVLVPKEFGGGHIVEHCYDGYGHFGGHDIFELIADWNRTYIDGQHVFPHEIKRYIVLKKYNVVSGKMFKFKAIEQEWWMAYSDLSLDKHGIEYVTGHEYRWIGIDLACYNEDNETLPFPIKITYDSDAIYENCDPSKSDTNQGCKLKEMED